MSVSFKKILLLATVVSALAAAGCSQTPSTGAAQIGVSTSALTSDVTKITVSISGLGLTTPMTTQLTKAQDGIQWTGHVEGIPTGTDGVFSAQAFNSSNVAIYQGSVSPVTITGGSTTVVVILLQDMNPSQGLNKDTPIISGISMSSNHVTPGALVNLTASASIPNGDTLSYLWSATCVPAGPAPSPNGSFSATTVNNPTWTAPNTASNVVSICTFSLMVSDPSLSGSTSVTTFFTIQVSVDTGKADVQAYVNTWPVISMLEADLVFTPATSLQAWTFKLTTTDPDGDNTNIVWWSSCQVNGGTWNYSAPNTVTTPQFNVFDSVDSCNFTVTVTDLCTNNDCGTNPNAIGYLANGAPRGGSVTGTVNGHLPATAQSAPLVTVTSVPNTSGPNGATVVTPGSNNILAVHATDPQDPSATLPLYFTWTANQGSFVAGSEADSSRDSSIVWLPPAPMSSNMSVTVKVTSQKSALSTTQTFVFVSTDPCVGQTDGTTCTSLNKCFGSASCLGGICTGSNPTVCTASDLCHAVGTCDPNSGSCSNPAKTDGSSCNDNNACTQTDTCLSGVCTGSNPVVCVALDACHQVGTCDTGTGVCSNPFQPINTPCVGTNKCNQTYLCDGAGTCVGSNTVNCASGVCMSGGTCDQTSGQCTGGTPINNGGTCDDGNICTTNDKCTNGTCIGTSCQPGTVCTSTGCVATKVTPQAVQLIPVPQFNGVAMDLGGNSYITGPIFTPTQQFTGVSGTINVTSNGGADVVVAKYDPISMKAVWARNYGDSSDQFGSGVGVTADNTVAVFGNYMGSLSSGSINLANTSTAPYDFLIGLDGATGNGKWGKSFNDGLGGAIVAIAANPALNLIAICGYTNQAATDLVPGATYVSGTTNIVIGMFKSDGTLVWSRQIGTAGIEECDSLVIDNNGDLYAAGKYNGVLDLGLGALPNPSSNFRRWLWVAKMSGTAPGTTLSNAAFYGCASGNCMNGVHTANSLALDSQNKLLVGGSFTNVLDFAPADATKEMTSAGGADAFVAKLDPAAGFARIWAVSMGSTLDDSTQGVAVDSVDDVVAVGYYGANTTVGPALTDAGSTDAFIWKLSGVDGSTEQAVGYGDAQGQSADRVAVNGQGTSNIDLVEIGGLLNGTITFPSPAGPLSATQTSSFLLFSNIK